VLPFVRFLRIASTVICLIVVASFLIFAVDQTSSAATQQKEEVVGDSQPAEATSSTSAKAAKHNVVKSDIEDVADELTSPFSGVVSAASSEWADRSVRALLALLVYGFGLGYLARALRVRV
jgi:hypothetical protein